MGAVSWYKLVVHVLLSAFAKSITIGMGGVSRYFSRVLGQGSIWLSWMIPSRPQAIILARQEAMAWEPCVTKACLIKPGNGKAESRRPKSVQTQQCKVRHPTQRLRVDIKSQLYNQILSSYWRSSRQKDKVREEYRERKRERQREREQELGIRLPLTGAKIPKIGERGFQSQIAPSSCHPRKGCSESKDPHIPCSALYRHEDFLTQRALFWGGRNWGVFAFETLFSRCWGFWPL